MKIYAPVKDANGVWATVRFVNGIGETDNPALVEWFRKHGYRVEKSDETTENEVNLVVDKPNEQIELVDDKVENDQPNFEAMTSDEIRAWAKENGLGGTIRNTRDKEKLIKLLRG
jgi:hypothetical protein